MSAKPATITIVAVAALSWGCAATQKVPVLDPAPAVAEPAVDPAPAPEGDVSPGATPSPVTIPAPAAPSLTPAAAAVPGLGLGVAPASDTPAEAALPPNVARFIETMTNGDRGKFVGAWITAQEARVYPEAAIPALVVGLQREAATAARARQLLDEIGPRAEPQLRIELERMKAESTTDPALERAINVAEQLLRAWR